MIVTLLGKKAKGYEIKESEAQLGLSLGSKESANSTFKIANSANISKHNLMSAKYF